MTRILSIGEVMLEMSALGGELYKKSYAGDTFNVAHYLNVVSGGRITADYLTAVGTDAESDACLAFLKDHGVSTARCQRDPHRTIGLFVLSNDENGEKQYGYWRGQSAARRLFDRPQDLSGYDLIYLSGITAAITEQKENLLRDIVTAKRQGAQIAYDFNHRVLLWEPGAARAFAEKILPLADLAKISDEDLAFLYPQTPVEKLSAATPQAEWVLTCGGDRGEVWKGGKLLARQKFTVVDAVVDSSAAGDSFIAAYLAEKLAGAGPLDGLKRGHAIASQVVLGKGSIVAIDATRLE